MKTLISALLICASSFGAVNTGTVHHVWSTGAAGNGGGFSTDATGFLTDGAATSATTASPVFTSASYNFVAGDVGAWIFIKSGTNWIPGWYEITSVGSNAATLIATAGTGTLYPSYGVSTATGVASTGSPTGATWGIDFSHQTGSELTWTDLVVGATTTEGTSVATPITVRMIGNVFNVTATCTTQHVTLQSVSGITGTFSTALGTAAQSCTAAMGGAKAAMTDPAAILVAGNIVFVKATATYTITATQTFSVAGSAGNPISYLGYTTTPGDNGQGTISSSTATVNCIAITAAQRRFYNFHCTTSGAPATNKGIVVTAGQAILGNVKVSNMSSSGIEAGSGSTNMQVFNSFLDANSNGFVSTSSADAGMGAMLMSVRSSNSTNAGFLLQGNLSTGGRVTCIRCIADNNGTDGWRVTDITSLSLINSIAYSNGSDGVEFTGTSTGLGSVIVNSVFVTDTANFGIKSTTVNWAASGVNQLLLNYNAFLNSGGGASLSQVTAGANDITLSADPFASSTNFALNGTAGGGAALKGAGFPGVLQSGGTGYLSVGALEPQNTGSGGQRGYVWTAQNSRHLPLAFLSVMILGLVFVVRR